MIEPTMWFIAAASLGATIANIHKKRWCFAVWLVTNLAFAVYDIHKTAYPQAALQLVYAGLSVYGIWKWRAVVSEPLDPWKHMVGCFKDDPTWDEYMRIIQEERKKDNEAEPDWVWQPGPITKEVRDNETGKLLGAMEFDKDGPTKYTPREDKS